MKPTLMAGISMFLLAEIASGAVLNKSDRDVLDQTNHITIPFVENKGQLKDPDTLFYSNTFAGRVSVNRDGSIGYRLLGNKAGREKHLIEIREKFCGPLKTSPSGEDKAIARVSHFQGKDPDKWVTDIPTFNTVHLGRIYPGISLKVQARGNNVEKIFSVHPGSDPDKIQMNIEGAKTLRLTSKGELEVDTAAGALRFSKPVAYQQINGRKATVDVAYTVKSGSYGFKLAAYDKTKELIIDPLITAIFQGTGDSFTSANCLAADSQGNLYAAGLSEGQLVVFKFDKRLETLQTSAFFGTETPNDGEFHILNDIAVDRHDAIYIVGGTKDVDFPVTQGALDTSLTKGGSSIKADGFIIKYNADLNKLLSSTFLGETTKDIAYGIAIDNDDTVVVVGQTDGVTANDTPFRTTPDVFDAEPPTRGNTKAFVARLDADLGELLASTLLGYDGAAYDVAIDAQGSIVVAGMTESENFHVTANCADASFQGQSEAFVSKFDPDLKEVLASTLLGGANQEKANVLAIAANNEIFVAGWTLSSDFPVVQGNYDTIFNSDEDGFVTRLNSELTTVLASTFLGGNEGERVSDIVIGSGGMVYLCGGTNSRDFPVAGDYYDNSFNGGSHPSDTFNGDGFLTILDQKLTTLSASTYLGGCSTDHITSIVLNKYAVTDGIKEDIIVAGATSSTNFPFMTIMTGHTDAFLCRFNPDETPEEPPFTGRPGHWSSRDSCNTIPCIFLDVNICDDGSFSGIWKTYFCTPSWWCFLTSDATPNPVSGGTIDFKNWNGKITMVDGQNEYKDLPFRILSQQADDFLISINPGGTADFTEGTHSTLHYRGDQKPGTCNGSGGSGGGGGGGSGGGGGGGCFIHCLFDKHP